MHRFFVPPHWIQGEVAFLQGPLARQIIRVLRIRKGDQFVLLDDEGWEYQMELEEVKEGAVRSRLLERRAAPVEPRLSVTLYQGLLKGKRFDWVLQKGTELGVASFVPMLCQRCVVEPDQAEGRLHRWQSIVREAAEQCGRGRLPRMSLPMSFQEACQISRRPSLLLWEGSNGPGIRDALRERFVNGIPQDICLFVGPEGGFSPPEVEWALGQGILPVSLGPRVFRGETAGLVGAAILLYEAGDLGGKGRLPRAGG